MLMTNKSLFRHYIFSVRTLLITEIGSILYLNKHLAQIHNFYFTSQKSQIYTSIQIPLKQTILV